MVKENTVGFWTLNVFNILVANLFIIQGKNNIFVSLVLEINKLIHSRCLESLDPE